MTEVKAVEQNFGNAEILSGQAASKAGLRLSDRSNNPTTAEPAVAFQSASHIHFACHGYFNVDNPLLSSLILAGENSSQVDSDVQEPLLRATRQRKNEAERENFTSYQVTDDQSIDLQRCLTLTDLVSLNLQNCHLVTLSACESGFTDFRALSDEYMGLPSGFLIAGAPTVVCSLWIVNDFSTALLI